MTSSPQPQPNSDSSLSLNGPDSGLITAAWAFEDAVMPKVTREALLAVELDRENRRMVIRPDADSSFGTLWQKVEKHSGKTVNVEPRAFGKECDTLVVAFMKDGEERRVEALRLKVEVAPNVLVLKSVIARVGDREVEVFNHQRLQK